MVHKKNLLFILYMLVGIIIILNVFTIYGTNSLFSVILSLLMTSSVIMISTYKSWKSNDLYQPITIINIIFFFIFVLRPLQLFVTNNLTDFLFFEIYFKLYGTYNIYQLPVLKALFIGLIGICIINGAYWIVRQSVNYEKITIPQVGSIDINKRIVKQWNNVYILFAFFFLANFLLKAIINPEQAVYSTIDILWIYIFCVVVILEQLITRKINSKIILIIVISILAFSILGNRQHIVNLLLCSFIPYVYLNNVKINKKISMLVLTTIFVIVWYGSIRRGADLSLASLFQGFVGEFSMFDMLVLGLEHKESFNTDFYFGYNYLVFLNYIIPGLNIDFFDFRHVQDVFGGVVGGGIPTSILGSLYFNFSYLGLILGSLFLGIFIAKKYNKYAVSGNTLSIAYYTLFLTFLYDLTRVGDIGREMINYFILFGCFKISLFILNEKKFISYEE